MKTIYLGLGSNLGDRKVNLRRALKLLPPKVKIEARSSVYETEPMYFEDDHKFYNIVVRGRTALSPEELLRHTQGIEAQMGRPSKTHNRPRVIDIDILTYDDETVLTEDLVIPHQRMHERAFVLVPLSEIAPAFVHPTTRSAISELLKNVSDQKGGVHKTNVRI